MIQDILLPILCIWSLYLGIGVLIHVWISKQENLMKKLDLPMCLGTSFLIGAGVSTLSQFLLSQIGVPLKISMLLFALPALAGLYKFYVLVKKSSTKGTFRLFSLQTIFWGLLSILLLLFFSRSISRVMYTWDSIAFWIPKMVTIWTDQGVRATTLLPFNHPEYPLLLPITGANAFTLVGAPNDIAAKAAIFGFTIAFACIAGSFTRRFTGERRSFFWVLLLFSLFILREHVAGEYVGTADILVGTYLAAGFAALMYKRPILAHVLWLLAAWAKSEGLVFAGISSFLLFIFYPQYRKWFVLFGSLLILPWKIFLRLVKFDDSQYFKFGEIYARPWVEYAVYSVHAFREEFRNLQKWNLSFYLFFAAVLTKFRRIIHEKPVFITFVSLVGQLVMYMVIFTVTPEEQASFIAASVSRLSLHLAPTAILMASYLYANKSQSE